MAKWLDKYNDGGPVQENYNDASASTGPDFVGLGYDTTGRNYSPAWGGQFQKGGFLQPNSSKLPEGYVIPYNTPSTELAMSIGGEEGEPAYLIPSFKGGKKLKDPIAEYKKTGEHLGGPFKTWQEAEKFGEMRHDYVEKGQSLPSPLKWWGEMAMGGSIPGSVGFTYARTNSPAPSNGKYAKKTLASAQNGQEMKFYQEGLDWTPKNISKNGSVIKDDMGQWAHPGEITEIGSNEITMQGVDYPVLGISDTGDTKMMYPDQDYKFDGKKVTEYPIAQDGENISKKLKKEAEERIERMKTPKATISQYTPKKGEMAKLKQRDLERIKDEEKLLNKFAKSKAAGNLEDAMMFAADVMTLGRAAALTKPALKAAAKYATEKTMLKNAYKLNPYAFKPTEGMMYRGLGETGMKDALASGVFRANPNVETVKLGRFDVTRQFSKAYFSPKFNVADQYGKGYIAEVPRAASDWGKRYARTDWSQIAQRDIPITEGKILQKHWLKGYEPIPQQLTSQSVTRGPINWWEEPGFMKRNPNFDHEAYVRTSKLNNSVELPEELVPRMYIDPNLPDIKENGGWLNKYQEGGTLMQDKKVGEKITEVAKYDLRPIKPNFKTTVKQVYDPNCPDGVGCSKQATDVAQSITGLPRVAYAPADAGYRDAVAERTGLINIFDQEGEQKKHANSRAKGWKYPTEQDFTTWRAGDIITLDAKDDSYFPYKAPKGFKNSDNTNTTHNGVIVGFTETGRPIITHGGASGKNKGKQITEVLGDDNRVTDLGRGRYAIKSVWRPKEVDPSGKVSSIENVIDTAEERAGRKQATTSNSSFYLKPTEEERLQKDFPVGAEFSGANTRLQTKNKLVDLFNNEKLDDDLQYKLGITAQELDKLKPVVYGVFGQESNFNDVDNAGASFKELIGNLFGNNSRGAAQIKMSSLTADEKKVLGIKKASDLDKDEVAYKAALLMLNNSRKRMNQEIAEGTHPELADKDEYFRAGYYYNSPARAIQTSEKFTKKKDKKATFSDIKKNELRMDEGSYPYKLMERAKDLGVNVDFDATSELEPVVVRSVVKNKKGTKFVPKQETGGWLKKYK